MGQFGFLILVTGTRHDPQYCCCLQCEEYRRLLTLQLLTTSLKQLRHSMKWSCFSEQVCGYGLASSYCKTCAASKRFNTEECSGASLGTVLKPSFQPKLPDFTSSCCILVGSANKFRNQQSNKTGWLVDLALFTIHSRLVSDNRDSVSG